MIAGKRWWGVAGVATAVAAFIAHGVLTAEPGPEPLPAQKMVRVRADGASFVMVGDAVAENKAAFDGPALLSLQQGGWRIVSVHMTAAAGTVPEQVIALVLLEKR